PFLENALWHGLSTKEGDKSIVLEVEKTASDFVTIKITDNGVGRAASRKIESNKSLNRKSVGIALTMERLANFSKNFSTSYRLNIIDLKDDQGNAMGTQVIIDIPVEQLRLKTA
ncbi:MAG: sensor histidine kinase, partial [Mangrovimonas sp.]|nr:sensor histidine kinase [Mangrovimonas sp.]